MKKTVKRDDLENFGSLITIKGMEGNCLGNLMVFAERGTYDAYFGKVPVTKEEADKHNAVLDKATVDGLDRNCEIGQCGTFYYSGGKVATFTGVVVSDDVSVAGRTITFRRNGKVCRGRLRRDGESFNFRRIQ